MSCCLRASEHSDFSWFSWEKAWLEWTGPVPCIPVRLCAPCWPTCVKRRQRGRGQVGLAKRVGGIKMLRNHQETPAALLSLSSTCSLPPSVLMTKNRATPIPSVGFVFVVSFPANFCFCWLRCEGWSSCSPHLTSCHYTEMLDISDDS